MARPYVGSRALEIPNYPMLRLLLVSAQRVKVKYPELEQMPRGQICPGYDINLIQSLAVLRYLCGVKTQWSCQGTHKEVISDLYILLAPEAEFPEDLTKQLTSAGFQINEVDDYDETGYTGKTRWKLSSCWDRKVKDAPLKKLNHKLLGLLDNWAQAKIREHLPRMKDPYFADVVAMNKTS